TGYNSNVPGHEQGTIRYLVYNGGAPKYGNAINAVAASGYEGVVLSADRNAPPDGGQAAAKVCRRSPTEFFLDLCTQLDVPVMVAGEAQHDVRGARVGVALDPGGRARDRSSETALAGAHLGGGHTVVVGKIGIDFFVGTLHIVVDGEREIDRAGEKIDSY